MRRNRALRSLCFHIPVVAIALLMLYPLLWMIASSLKENNQIFTEAHSLIPNPVRLVNYINGWKGMGGTSFGVFFGNSLFVSVFSTVGAVSSSSLIAYGFARNDFKLKSLWFTCMMGMMLLPDQILTVPQYILFKQLGWINTYLPLIVPKFTGQAFFIFLNMQFMRGVPAELDESAMIDGCTKLGIYRYILLPLSVPALITSTIFSFYWTWQDFFGPLIYLSKPAKYTFSVAMNMFADPTVQTDWGGMFAMATLSLVPVVLIFLFFQKYLVEGVATTGIKG